VRKDPGKKKRKKEGGKDEAISPISMFELVGRMRQQKKKKGGKGKEKLLPQY